MLVRGMGKCLCEGRGSACVRHGEVCVRGGEVLVQSER